MINEFAEAAHAERVTTVSAEPVGSRAVPAADEERREPADYADRDGYDPSFLGGGTRVALPEARADRKTELAPVIGQGGYELKYRHFSVIVNGQRRFPMVTGVNIDGAELRRVPGVRNWRLDPRIAPEHQVGNELYAQNSLDKGHMVRRLDPVWGSREQAVQANDDTHHYTNACPQDHTFNDSLWGDLEDHVLDSAPVDGRLCVLTGPVLAADDPEYRGLRIPRQFWKVVAWRKDALRAAGFLLSQERYIGALEFNPYRYSTFQVTLANLGGMAGLDFGALDQVDVWSGRESAAKQVIRVLDDIEL